MRRSARGVETWTHDRNLTGATPPCQSFDPVRPSLRRGRRAGLGALPGAARPRTGSSDLLAPTFERRRYWHGPVWVNLNWLLARGPRTHGLDAAALEATTLRLVEAGGMREYFDPLTGEGRGADDFSWTAALALDLLS
jgi:glycogen debranching enzyme